MLGRKPAPEPEPHEHKVANRIGVTLTGSSNYPETIILVKCDCRAIYTVTLKGTWTLEQLNG